MCTSVKYLVWFEYLRNDVSVNDKVSAYLHFTTYSVNVFVSSQIWYEIIEKVTKVKPQDKKMHYIQTGSKDVFLLKKKISPWFIMKSKRKVQTKPAFVPWLLGGSVHQICSSCFLLSKPEKK